MNDQGVIVGVHEAGRGGNGLYYRVGHLRNPVGGDYTIQWDSPSWGIKYDTGVNPSIAINNRNEVVQVHQVPEETLLHYRRGTVSGGEIRFGDSWRYDNYAEDPTVALLDSGMVLEVHSLGGLISRTGMLSPSDPQRIDWFEPVKVNESGHVKNPALAVNGTHALETHSDYYKTGFALDYSVATICTPTPDGTLVMDSSGKVYVDLNNYRHWIPDQTTFNAMGYQWNNIVTLSDLALIEIQEGTPFPSAAR